MTMNSNNLTACDITKEWIDNCNNIDVLKGAINLIQKDELKKSAEEKLFKLNSVNSKQIDDAADQRLKGNECVKSKNWKEAIMFYSKSIELNPNEPSTYGNRALAYIKIGDYDNALNDSNVCISTKIGRAHV